MLFIMLLMKTITLASAKGGVGKSASAISISYILNELGYKVLLVDADPQNAITRHFVNGYSSIEKKTIRQVLLTEVNLADCLISAYDRVDFIPSQLRLLNIEKELADENNPLFILHDILQEVDSEYDYCVIDTPPWMGMVTKSALISSDIIIIPTILEKWPVEAIEIIFENIEKAIHTQKYLEKKIQSVYLLPTFYEERIVVLQAYLQALKEDYPEYITKTSIHKAADIGRTYSIEGAALEKKSRAYQEYLSLVNEIIRRNDGKEI